MSGQISPIAILTISFRSIESHRNFRRYFARSSPSMQQIGSWLTQNNAQLPRIDGKIVACWSWNISIHLLLYYFCIDHRTGSIRSKLQHSRPNIRMYKANSCVSKITDMILSYCSSAPLIGYTLHITLRKNLRLSNIYRATSCCSLHIFVNHLSLFNYSMFINTNWTSQLLLAICCFNKREKDDWMMEN